MSNGFEIAVGQAWKPESYGESAEIVSLGVNNLCVRYADGDLGTYTEFGLRENYTLTKHQSGADIDCEAYEYFSKYLGHVDYDCEYWNVCEWRPTQYIDSGVLTRKPKAQELPYVDCAVFFSDEWDDLRHCMDGGSEEYPNESALGDPKFIGYVYAEGLVTLAPRIPSGENNPAEIPTHVRFAR